MCWSLQCQKRLILTKIRSYKMVQLESNHKSRFEFEVDHIVDGLRQVPPRICGFLTRIVGLTLEAKGLKASVGSVCRILKKGTDNEFVEAQVVGFQEGVVYLMPLWDSRGLQAGDKVYVKSEADFANVSDSLIGRVVDSLGEPLDGKGPILIESQSRLAGEPINPMDRTPIDRVLDVGVRAINALLTIGCGQRIGLVAGSGVGKSVLLAMLTKFTSADIVVIGLIGERGREVKEFVENTLGQEGMANAIVVAAPADQSPLLRIRATNLAHLYAEHYRAQGKDVLLLVDSLTRVAHAQREIGLAVGEPPTAKGYPPSVFSLLPRLIERTGTGKTSEGSITAVYTLLAEGDDLNDPVVDLARASLDGQVILSRDLADAAHYPAIDLAGSISRLMPIIVENADLSLANRFRRLWTLYQQNQDLIQVGAYSAGSNSDIDQAIELRASMENFLRQPMDELASVEDSFSTLKVVIESE